MKIYTQPQQQIINMFLNAEFTNAFYELYDDVMDKKILEAAKENKGDVAVNYAKGSEYIRSFVNSITNDKVKADKAKEKKDNSKSKKGVEHV